MQFELKTISKDGIPEAIAKAELYRNHNEPEESESICHDILAADPEHQVAMRILGLAITDQFTGDVSDRYAEAEGIFQGLADAYERQYYMGLLCERRAKAQMRAGRPPQGAVTLLHEAMTHFAAAEQLRPSGNDDALLRWNRCARLLHKLPHVETPAAPPSFEDHDTAPVAASPWSAKSSR